MKQVAPQFAKYVVSPVVLKSWLEAGYVYRQNDTKPQFHTCVSFFSSSVFKRLPATEYRSVSSLNDKLQKVCKLLCKIPNC